MAAAVDAAVLRVLANSGGYVQRAQGHAAAAMAEVAEAQPSHSILSERVLLLVGWGIISANTAQWLCAGAVADGGAHPDIAQIELHGALQANFLEIAGGT